MTITDALDRADAALLARRLDARTCPPDTLGRLVRHPAPRIRHLGLTLLAERADTPDAGGGERAGISLWWPGCCPIPPGHRPRSPSCSRASTPGSGRGDAAPAARLARGRAARPGTDRLAAGGTPRRPDGPPYGTGGRTPLPGRTRERRRRSAPTGPARGRTRRHRGPGPRDRGAAAGPRRTACRPPRTGVRARSARPAARRARPRRRDRCAARTRRALGGGDALGRTGADPAGEGPGRPVLGPRRCVGRARGRRSSRRGPARSPHGAVEHGGGPGRDSGPARAGRGTPGRPGGTHRRRPPGGPGRRRTPFCSPDPC